MWRGRPRPRLTTKKESSIRRKPKPRRGNRTWVVVPAVAGRLVLFESWLRHEVPPAQYAGQRISISFNYGWSRKQDMG